MTLRRWTWDATTDWLYDQAPGDLTANETDQWVANYLAEVKHFDALEEHLRRVKGGQETIEARMGAMS